MKKFAKIAVLLVALSVMLPLTTYATSLVGTSWESAGFTFTRQVVGAHGGAPHNGTPGEFSTQMRGNDGQLMNGGEWFTAFCVEPGPAAQNGGELIVQAITPEEKNGGLQAAWLIDTFYDDANSNTQIAALQIAVWEAIVDNHGNYDLSGGNFKIWGGSEHALYDANSYLAKMPTSFDVDYLNSNYLIAVHSSKQDLIVKVPGGVPEPSTLLLLGSGMLGAIAIKRKRTKK